MIEKQWDERQGHKNILYYDVHLSQNVLKTKKKFVWRTSRYFNMFSFWNIYIYIYNIPSSIYFIKLFPCLPFISIFKHANI